MPVFKEERILDLPVKSDAMPEPALGSPAYQPYPSPPALPSSGVGIEENNQSRRGLTNDQLSQIAKIPGQQTGPNLIPLSEVIANKRYNTYVRGMDLENVYGLQQSWLDQLGNSVVKFAGLTVGTFLQSFASIPNTISALKSDTPSERLSALTGKDGYESGIDNWIKNFEDSFPNYYTRRERENPLLGAIPFMPGSANFWGDKIFKNMGFMAGAIGGAVVQDVIIGAATEGVGAAPVVAGQLGKASLWLNKIFSGTNKIDNVLDAARVAGATEKTLLDIKKLGEIAEGIRVTNGLRYGLNIYSSARTEAAIEARDSYRVLKEELTKDYIRLNGEEPTGAALAEIEDYATAGMNTRFGVNMALLTVSNAAQFGNFIKSLTTTSARGVSGALTSSIDDVGMIGLKNGSLDVFEKVVSPTKVGRIWDNVKPIVKNIFTEGIYEEGGQFAAEKGVYDYYTRKYKNLYDPKNKKNWDGLTEVMSSTLKAMNEQFTSTEGIESMIIGALTAGITSPIIGKIQRKMGVPSDEERLQSTLNTMNLYGLTGIISDQRDDAISAIGIAAEMDDAVKSGDVFRFKNLKHDMFFNYVSSRIPIGMHDVTIEQLKMLKGLDKKEFEKTFGIDFNTSNKKTVNEYVDALVIKANQIKDISTSIDSTFRNPYRLSINPVTQEEATETSKHLTFNKWKKDLIYYASKTPELKGREMDIQSNLMEIDPRLSIGLLKSVSDKDSIKEIATQYEEKAKQLGKTITDLTPIPVAKKIREEMRYLRTLSEKINLAIGKQNIDDKLFNDVLNFELNGQDINADKAVSSEKNNQLFTYGIDLNRIENLKRRVASLFDDLSSEEGFNKYFEQEEKMNEDLEKEGEKKPTKEAEEPQVPNVFQYENKQGTLESVELDREYQIPPYKTARVSKIDEDRYQVEKPDGTLAFYNTQEDADAAVEEFNEQFRNLEKVKVVGLNPDGTVKVEDAVGDVYDISLNNLKGYERIKTEQEKLEKFKEDIENQQSEVEIDSSSVPSVEMDFSGLTDRSGNYKGDPLDFRKPWQWLYWSTTSASEDVGEDWKKPHSIRSITFLNNARNFKNRNRLRVMIVSAKQEDFLGLSGLTELSMGEAPKRDGDGNVIVSDVENGFIAAVYIEQDGNQRWFVNEKGERIGKVGEKVDVNQVVFNTMPDTSLFWDLGGERYREKEEKEAKEMSARWSLKRAQLFDLPIDSPEIYTFDISRGLPTVDDINQKNHVGGVFLDENKVKTQEGLIVVSTKGTLSHNGQTYNISVGRAMIQYQDVFEPAINNKFNKKQAEAIFEVMRLLAADIKRQADNNQKIVFNPFYADFLKNTLYWRKDDKTKKNQMYIDGKMNLFFAGKKYDITKLEDFKNQIIGDLLNAYHNVNNKYLATKEEGGVNKFHEPFVEYYFDAANKLQEREWTNYQSYLLSAKYPDGSSRNVEDTPVTTFVNKVTDSTPYNFKQKYAILSPVSFPALPVKQAEPAAPKGAVKAGKYNVGTTEAVENTFTGFSNAVGPVTFTAKLNENNELDIEVVDDSTSNKAVANAKANDGVMSIIEKTLKDRFDVDNVDASVILFIREKIKVDLMSFLSKKEEKEEAPVKPSVAPIRIGDVNFLPDNISVYTSKKAFISGAPIQFRIESIDDKGYPIVVVNPEDQTSDTISQVAKNANAVSQIDNFLKQINKFNEASSNEDRVALFASIKIYSNLKDQIDESKKEPTPTQAPVSDKKTKYKREDFPDSQTNTRTPITQKLLDYFAEVAGVPKYAEDLSTGTYISWLKNASYQATMVGQEVATLLNSPKKAFDVIDRYDKELAALERAKPAATPSVANVEQQRSLFSIFQRMFYEAQGKRGDNITDEQLAGLTPETKSYLVKLYETLKPFNSTFQRLGKILNPQNNKEIVSDDDKIRYVTSMYFGGLGRPSTELGSPSSPKHKDLVFPVPTSSVLENLNTVMKASVSSEEISKSSSPAAAPSSIEIEKGKIRNEAQSKIDELLKDVITLRKAKSMIEADDALMSVTKKTYRNDMLSVIANMMGKRRLGEVSQTDELPIDIEFDQKGPLEFAKDFADFLEKQLAPKIEEIRNEANKKIAKLGEALPTATPAIEEAPITPKKKKGGKKHEDDEYSRFRMVGVKEKKKEKITEADIDVFKKWHQEKVPTLPYEISERIFMLKDGRRAYGVFADGVAKFYKGAIRGTEYHEVFEGIWSAFLTPEERQAILDELRAKSGTFTDRETGKKIRWDEATDNQIKERIADDFAEYRLGKLPARSLIEKIVRFFKNIINYFRSVASKPSLVDELFNNIEAGKFAESVVPDSVKAQAPQYRAEEGLTETQTREYVEDMAALMFQYIFGTNKSLYDIQKITDVDLYNYVKGKYEASEKIDDTDTDFISTNQFNGLFKKTIDFLRVFKIEFDVDSVGDINSDENDNRNYAPEPFSTDWKKTSPYPIKLLLGTLIQTKPSGRTTSSGIPMPDTKWSDVDGYKLVNFSRMFATSLEKLSNTTSVKNFIDKVFDMARANTDYFRLLTRLKMNAETLNVDFDNFESQDWRLFIQFYQTFTKQKPNAYIQYVSGGKTYIQAANLFTAAREVKDDWISNMKVMSRLPNSIISYISDEKGRSYQVKDVSKVDIKTPEQMVGFLKNLGIEFPISTYDRLKKTPEIGEKSQQEQFINAVSSIKTYLSKEKDLVSLTGKTLKVDRHIAKLAELYVLVENPPHETTRFNVEDERVVEYTNNNYSSVFENEFNESETLEDLMAKRPELNDTFSASSLVLKKGGLFWNEDGTLRKKIKVGVIEGEKDVDGSKNKKTSALGFGKRSILELNNNLNGDYYILIPADASTEWTINLGNNISYKTVMGGKAFTKIHPIFRAYLDDEVNLAMSDRSYLQLTAPRAKELRFFKEILPEDMVKEIHSLIEDGVPKSQIDKYINENIDKVNSSVDSFIQSFVNDNMKDLLKTGQVVNFADGMYSFKMLNDDFVESEDVKLDKDNLTEKELMDVLTFANINYVINNIELHKVLFGDPYQFKISGTQLDAVKRIKSFLSPRMTTFDTPEFNTHLNQEYNKAGEIELEGRSDKKPFGDIGHHTFKSYINTVTLSDVKIRGTVYGDLLETNETDGFSFMMDVLYRETKLKNGQWVEERAEPWHQWQMAYTRNKLAKRGIYEYTNPTLQRQDEATISRPSPKHMIEVLKPIVSGNKGNRNTIDLVLDKFSQMPLYYSMVEGTNLEEEYIKMWKGEIGYAVYESGRKVGVEQLNSVYKKDGEFNTDPFKNIIQVPWKAYGIQVETAYDKFKEDVTRGSQPAKVVSIDLFDNGVPVSEAAKKEYDRYLLINDRLHETLYKDLLQKIGLEDLGDSFFIRDRVALSKALQNEVMRRQFSSNVKDSVQVNEDGQFPIPFEASNAYKSIRDIIFSMVHKSINSPKMHGGAYVQVPVTMFEKLGSSRSLVVKKEIAEGKYIYAKISKEEYQKLSEEEKKNVYLTDDTLKMPTKDDPYMEVMLPHWFRENLPKKLKGLSDEELLKYLNNTKDGKELLQGIGFRIPTQALSSISPIRVKGFLPQYAGYTVVVPSEITTMAGSDFDIDKLFMYLKSFYITENDEIALIKYYNNEQETKDFYRNVYETTIQKKIDKLSEYDAFRNKLLDVFEKLDNIEQFDEAEEFSLEDLKVLGEETYDFATTHAEIINAIMDQADEANVSPTEYLQDQIKRLDNNKDKLTKELLNSQLKEDYVRKMHKRALENAYYKSMENMLTLPENYDRLMSVVDDAGLKDVAKELDRLTGEAKREKAIKNKLLSRTFMSRLRHSFVTAKRWVGIAAVNITGHSNAQKSATFIDPSRFSRLDDFDKKILGDGSVALPHNTYKVGNNVYVSISGTKTADGKNVFISSRLSGYATTFVDVAKDPYIMKIIKGDLAVGTFMFLERIGAGETVPFFMNQPIIATYLEMLDNVDARTLFSKKYVDLILAEFPSTDKAIEEAQLDVSLTAMKNNIESFYENEGKMNDEYNAKQRLIFMEFLKYAKMAEYNFKFTQASNYDTTKFKSADSLFRKQTRTKLARDTNIFSSVDEVLKKTQIGVQAYYLDRSTSAIGEYLQLDKPEIRSNINNVILEQYAENDYLSADKFDKIGMRVTSSLLDFLLQTRTGINGQINQLTTDATTSAAALLEKAKQKYPDDDLIKSLQIRQTIEGGAWTVKLKGNMKASPYDEDYFIGRMRELRDNPDTNELFRALVKLSVLQGSYQSSTSIKNIIPVEDYQKEIGDVMNNLRYSLDMDVFTKGMFYRNQWKNEDIFKRVYPNFVPTGFDFVYEDDVLDYYKSESFPVINFLGPQKIGQYSNRVLVLSEKYNFLDTQSDFVLVDRFLKKPASRVKKGKSNPVIDIQTGEEYTDVQYRKMFAKGDPKVQEVYGYQKVRYPDGTPLVKYDADGTKSYVYKLINLYGDGSTFEYYNEFKKSVLENGTIKLEQEISDDLLIEHFTSSSVNMKPDEGVIQAKAALIDVAPPPTVAPTTPVSGLSSETKINIYAGTGENADLSNFAVRPFTFQGVSFNSVEQAYQSLKGGKFDKATYDNKAYIPFNRNGIMTVSKFRGPLGTTTDAQQTQLMGQLIKASFEQNPAALEKLLATGNATLTHIGTEKPNKWTTEFPKLLMEVREELKTFVPTTPVSGVEVVARYTDADVKANRNKVYVFGDNVQRVGTGGQAQIRNNPNAMGIATKLAPSMESSAFMNDKDLTTNKSTIDADIAKIKATGKVVVFPKDGLGTGLAKLKEKAPQTYAYLKQRLLQEFGFNNDTGAIASTFTSSFSVERQKEIIKNFATKHKMNEREALKNIEEAISSRGQDAIDQLNECY